MVKSDFQIPHHVAIRIFVYAPPRCFSADNSGAGGDGFPHSEEKDRNKNCSLPHNCEEVEAKQCKSVFIGFRHC